jgi:predicted AAA+ superfamily ATPase
MKIMREYQNLGAFLKPNKALVILGPRQSGKTTLLNDFLSGSNLKYKLDSGDDIRVQEVLSSQDFAKILAYAGGYQLVAIDEAKKIKNVGLGLKILIDHVPGIHVIATGSSSFELSGQVGEPLTGRKITLTLYPIAQMELAKMHNRFELKAKLEESLIFGSYPEVVTAADRNEKIRLLNELVGFYLLKDILQLERVKSAKVLLDLLRLLAFQIGNEVSWSELANRLGIDTKTVARYLDLFEKGFVIYNLRAFSRNLRKEICKKSKYYFLDTGIRNAVISNFNPLEIRDDAGLLWENFLITERLKKQAYRGIHADNYFWRTWDRKEVDFIEEREGRLFGYEFKWGSGKIKPAREWLETYAGAEFAIVNSENYLDFVL